MISDHGLPCCSTIQVDCTKATLGNSLNKQKTLASLNRHPVKSKCGPYAFLSACITRRNMKLLRTRLSCELRFAITPCHCVGCSTMTRVNYSGALITFTVCSLITSYWATDCPVSTYWRSLVWSKLGASSGPSVFIWDEAKWRVRPWQR